MEMPFADFPYAKKRGPIVTGRLQGAASRTRDPAPPPRCNAFIFREPLNKDELASLRPDAIKCKEEKNHLLIRASSDFTSSKSKGYSEKRRSKQASAHSFDSSIFS